MRNMKIKIILAFFLVFLFLTSLFLLSIGEKGIGKITDKLNLSKNTYHIQVDKSLRDDIYIYWFGETVVKDEKNKMLIYYKELQSEVPPSYGANWIEVKYKSNSFSKIFIWKTYAYSKYNYNIKVKEDSNSIIIQWEVSNWYDTEFSQGIDTIKAIQ